jgi:hypothetical protein
MSAPDQAGCGKAALARSRQFRHKATGAGRQPLGAMYKESFTRIFEKMKTYHNAKLGFEIELPDEWSFLREEQVSHALGKDDSLLFHCGANQAFNMQIGLVTPLPLSQTEDEFKRYAQSRGYTSLEFGRCLVAGMVHVWGRYYTGNGTWTKKYMIVFGETEYAITATCFNKEELSEKEKIWDAVVASLHLPQTDSHTGNELEAQAYMFYETGYRHFRAGRYQEALDQFEQGKLLTKKHPGNYFGVCMTVMQMIGSGAVPKDQIGYYLEKAEINVDECLRIAPTRQDYRTARQLIGDFKKRYLR